MVRTFDVREYLEKVWCPEESRFMRLDISEDYRAVFQYIAKREKAVTDNKAAEAFRQARSFASFICLNRWRNTLRHATAAPAIPCFWHRRSVLRSARRVRTMPSGFRVPSPNAGINPRRFSRISFWIEQSPD